MSTTEERRAFDVPPARLGAPIAGDAAIGDDPQPRRKIVFGVAAIGLFMASVDQTIVATALNDIQRDLHAPLNLSGWTITLYALGQIVTMPVAGRLSDLYGRHRIFLAAIVLFTVSSLLCGLSWNIYMLIPLRLVQSLGGGAFMPSATGIVSDMFGSGRDRALGMFTSVFSIGGIAGPALGGILVEYGSWRSIFLVNVPLGVVMFALAVRLIPRTPPAHASPKLDAGGVALLSAGLLALMFGIFRVGESRHAFDGMAITLIAAGVAILAAFAWHERRQSHPMIPVELMVGRGFGVMNLINFLFGCAALGCAALLPLYGEQRYGISPLSAGTLLMARAVGSMVFAALCAMSLRRIGVRMPMIVGTALTAASLILMGCSPLGGLSPYAWLSVTAIAMGVGMGVTLPASNNAIMQLARDRLASIAGLRGMFRQSGGIVAVAISTALVTRTGDAGAAIAETFVLFGALVGATLALVWLVPDHRGRF